MAGGHGGNEALHIELKTRKPLKYYGDVAKRWTPSLMGFGFFAGSMFLYFTDWKIFMDKVPFYRKKFEEREPIV